MYEHRKLEELFSSLTWGGKGGLLKVLVKHKVRSIRLSISTLHLSFKEKVKESWLGKEKLAELVQSSLQS